MFLSLLQAIASILALYLINLGCNLWSNIQKAERSGIPYVVVPFYTYDLFFSLFGGRLLARTDSFLPKPDALSWRFLCRATWPWRVRYEPFRRLGTDTFITVAPGGLILYTADPAVITQITTRRNDFPKPTFLYRTVSIYGSNIVSTEGDVWRRHRKLTSPAFGERNNQLVWEETLRVTQSLASSWMRKTARGETVHSLLGDTMRLSLNVFSRAGFGEKQEVPGVDQNEMNDFGLENKHKMKFADCIEYLLKNIFYIILMPQWLLKILPSRTFNMCSQAYMEWGQYMRELVAAKKQESPPSTPGGSKPPIDLLGQLVKGSEEWSDTKGIDGAATLSDTEVMGNLFMFIIAGHETTASSIHFCLMFLALHPEIQKKAQKELQEVLGDRPVSEWDYDRDFHRLFNGYLSAIINEELRVIPPVITIPKRVCDVPQSLAVNGRDAVVPPGLMIKLCVSAVHRNPKYWPHNPPTDGTKPYFPPSNIENDLEEFKPERWLTSEYSSSRLSTVEPETPASAPGSAPFFDPPKGAYIPFSDGARSCLGRRFALVEILAALAVVLTQSSVELAVDDWAADEEVERMSREERRRVWNKARDRTCLIWQNKMNISITLKLKNAHVPLRFVRRGEEKFWDLGL